MNESAPTQVKHVTEGTVTTDAGEMRCDAAPSNSAMVTGISFMIRPGFSATNARPSFEVAFARFVSQSGIHDVTSR
jgi:hypothetical protein